MILYDLIALQPQGNVKSHGGGTYARLVLERILERDIPFVAFYNSKIEFDQNLRTELELHEIKLYDISKESFKSIVKQTDKPLVFSILPKPYMFIAPTIGTIHDCRELELPNDKWQLYYPTIKKQRIVYYLKKIFKNHFFEREKRKLSIKVKNPNFTPTTITQYTKNQLKKFFYLEKTINIRVFMTPFSQDLKPAKIYLKKDNTILLVSGERWLKNNLRAIIALDELFTEGVLNEYEVVITGAKDINIYKIHISNKDKFKTVGYVSSEELQNLYRISKLFVFPSLNEGFGIPPLEAMKYGTPVVASNISAIPEVCGEAAIYINPFSISDIKEKVINVLSHDDLYRKLQKKGYTRYQVMIEKTISDLDNYIDFVISIDRKNNG